MKIYSYITSYHHDDTCINAYEFSILPTICLVKDIYGNKKLFIHWLLFGTEISF